MKTVTSLIAITIMAFALAVRPCDLFAATEKKSNIKQPPVPVVTEDVREMTFREQATFIGTVEPDRRSLVATEVSGKVEDILFDEGDFVGESAVIARLKADSIQIRLQEARAAMNEAEARLAYASEQIKRFINLYERSVIPVEELQKSQSEQNAWTAKTRQYRSRIERLEYDINQTQIRAPFSGHITAKHAEVGEWLVMGAPVFELISLDSIHALVNVPEHIAVTLKHGDTAGIRFDALPDISVDGVITAVIPQASRSTRTLPVKVGFRNEGSAIKGGLSARVSFGVGSETESLLVTKDAIVEMNSQKFVFTVNDNKAAPIPVETGIAYDGLIEIVGPVKAGMTIIVRGNERVRPGQSVRIVD